MPKAEYSILAEIKRRTSVLLFFVETKQQRLRQKSKTCKNDESKELISKVLHFI